VEIGLECTAYTDTYVESVDVLKALLGGPLLHIHSLHWPARGSHGAFMITARTMGGEKGFPVKPSLLNSRLFPLSLLFILRGIRDWIFEEKTRGIQA